MDRLLISAAHKSSGKTTVSLGLCAAFSARGVVVQPYKKGPDYIDPMWLGRACGRDCRNLDPFLMEDEEILALFCRHATGAGISIVEGNKGLYDGLALDGSKGTGLSSITLAIFIIAVILFFHQWRKRKVWIGKPRKTLRK